VGEHAAVSRRLAEFGEHAREEPNLAVERPHVGSAVHDIAAGCFPGVPASLEGVESLLAGGGELGHGSGWLGLLADERDGMFDIGDVLGVLTERVECNVCARTAVPTCGSEAASSTSSWRTCTYNVPEARYTPWGIFEDMQFPEQVSTDVIKRLRRLEGQVRGIQRMIEEGDECRNIVTQLAAARGALDRVGFKLMAAALSSPDMATDTDELEKLFLKLT